MELPIIELLEKVNDLYAETRERLDANKRKYFKQVQKLNPDKEIKYVPVNPLNELHSDYETIIILAAFLKDGNEKVQDIKKEADSFIEFFDSCAECKEEMDKVTEAELDNLLKE